MTHSFMAVMAGYLIKRTLAVALGNERTYALSIILTVAAWLVHKV